MSSCQSLLPAPLLHFELRCLFWFDQRCPLRFQPCSSTPVLNWPKVADQHLFWIDLRLLISTCSGLTKGALGFQSCSSTRSRLVHRVCATILSKPESLPDLCTCARVHESFKGSTSHARCRSPTLAVNGKAQHEEGTSSWPAVVLNPPGLDMAPIYQQHVLSKGCCQVEVAQPQEVQLHPWWKKMNLWRAHCASTWGGTATQRGEQIETSKATVAWIWEQRETRGSMTTGLADIYLGLLKTLPWLAFRWSKRDSSNTAWLQRQSCTSSTAQACIHMLQRKRVHKHARARILPHLWPQECAQTCDHRNARSPVMRPGVNVYSRQGLPRLLSPSAFSSW